MGDSERKVINVNSDLLAHTLRNLTKRRSQSDGPKTKRATTSPGIMLKPDIKNKRALLNATRKFRQQRQQQNQDQLLYKPEENKLTIQTQPHPDLSSHDHDDFTDSVEFMKNMVKLDEEEMKNAHRGHQTVKKRPSYGGSIAHTHIPGAAPQQPSYGCLKGGNLPTFRTMMGSNHRGTQKVTTFSGEPMYASPASPVPLHLSSVPDVTVPVLAPQPQVTSAFPTLGKVMIHNRGHSVPVPVQVTVPAFSGGSSVSAVDPFTTVPSTIAAAAASTSTESHSYTDGSDPGWGEREDVFEQNHNQYHSHIAPESALEREPEEEASWEGRETPGDADERTGRGSSFAPPIMTEEEREAQEEARRKYDAIRERNRLREREEAEQKQREQMEKYTKTVQKKIVRRKLRTGKIRDRVSILIPNKTIRNRVDNHRQAIHQTPIQDVKKYLIKRGFLKVGSTAPNDVLRKMYEELNLLGNMNNQSGHNLVYNFRNSDQHDGF
jgi:hypothetical protein